MKAIVLKAHGGVENFVLSEVPDPEIKKDEVLIQIKACSFNPADYQIRQGGPETNVVSSMILGRDLSGIVLKAGENVSTLKPGDEIMAYSSIMGSNGSNAELIALPANVVGRKPANLTWAQAAALPVVGLTALQTIRQANLRPDQSIFVTGGSGGVGTFFIKLAQYYGITNIITTAGSEESKEYLINLGLRADQIVDYRQDDLIDKILHLNKGEHYDVCIDFVGGKISEVAAMVLKIRGTFVDIPFLSTHNTRTSLFNKSATVQNIAIYSNALTQDEKLRTQFSENLNVLSDLFEQEALAPMPVNEIGGFSVESVQNGHTLLEGNALKGKLVMTIN